MPHRFPPALGSASLALALLVACACAHAAPASVTRDRADRTMAEALSVIEAHFIQPLTREQLVERALRLLLKDLDPYSSYLTPSELADFQAALDSEFVGVGVTMTLDEKTRLPVVKHLSLQGAATASGVRRGDTIASVDGQSLRDLPFADIALLLRGPKGSDVRLSLLRPDSSLPVEITVRRAMVKTPSVRGVRWDPDGRADYMLSGDKGIGYIRVSALARDTVPAMREALTGLRWRGMRGLVLDLRDCTGGLMTAALGAADLFIDSGTILTLVERGTRKNHLAKPGEFLGFPMVVLINAGTVSSGEILAGALKDSGRASLIGQRTFGKGRVQVVYPVGATLGGVSLSTATFQRPSGKTIDRHELPDNAAEAGIAPDPGMEMIIAGKQYTAWQEHTALMDSRLALSREEQTPRLPDRMLDRAMKVLASRLRARP